MPLVLAGFRGELPRIEARNLPPTHAQEAVNCEFEQTTLYAIRKPGLVHTFGSDVLSIYRHNGVWLGWNAVVDVARAPVAQDRLYYTGDGVPKVRDSGTVYNLALPKPTGAPTTTNLSVPAPQFIETILFVYTYVTSLGEESAPSPVSAALDWSPGVVTRVNGFAAVPSGRAITHRRIYRSQTSAAGVTGFYFAGEITIATTSFDFDIGATPLQEALLTTNYDTPPDTLTGLVSMPNGMMAAFSGKDVYFCETYKPHAWPLDYVLTVDWPVVGLAAFGTTLAILTQGSPYIAQGSHPDEMRMEKVETGLPCTSRRGIVDLGYAAIYPSPEGLALIAEGETRLLTTGIYTQDQWQDLVPDSIIAQRHKGRYLFCFTEGAGDEIIGGAADGWDTPPAVDTIDGGAGDGWDETPVDLYGGDAFSVFGTRLFASIDTTLEAPDVVNINIDIPSTMWRDESSHEMFFLGVDKREVYRWADPAQPPSKYRWRSKLFGSVSPVSFGAAFFRTTAKVRSGDSFEARVFADGKRIATITKANTIARLPAGRMAEEWEVEIIADVPVNRVILAQTAEELTGAEV